MSFQTDIVTVPLKTVVTDWLHWVKKYMSMYTACIFESARFIECQGTGGIWKPLLSGEELMSSNTDLKILISVAWILLLFWPLSLGWSWLLSLDSICSGLDRQNASLLSLLIAVWFYPVLFICYMTQIFHDTTQMFSSVFNYCWLKQCYLRVDFFLSFSI